MNPARPAPILPLALILTVLLTAWWAARAWADLGSLRLPDPDDMLRLAQIRDWLDGQGFADMKQARLGPVEGTAMHWSRLPDLVPALVMRLLSPLMGVTRAEIAAVILWPELLFFAHLLLAGALARRLGGDGIAPPAVALAALAWPAIALFLPGRIDHHGLQIVLIESMMLGLVASRLFLAGAAAGTSLVVGIEGAPVILAAMAWLGGAWVRDRRSIAGLGLGLMAAALAGFALLRPADWPGDRCDSFTPSVFALMMIGSGLWLVLAGLAPRLPDARWRAGSLAAVALLALASAWVATPACFANPYGPPDPLLAAAWPRQVGEYGGAAGQSLGTIIAWLGLPLMGLGSAAVAAAREPKRRQLWVLLGIAIGAALLASLVQLRSAWFASALAAPGLAWVVQRVRARGFAWLATTWLLSAGLVWQVLGSLADARPPVVSGCADRETLAAMDRLDTGNFAAPLDLGAYLVGRTQHRSLGGPYHRNAQGNRALADFFRSSPEQARYQASLWTIDYVALCPVPGGGLPAELVRPGGLAARLLAGDTPDWLQPVPLIGSDVLVWRVRAIAGPRFPS